MNIQRPKTKIKKVSQKYKEIYRMNCLIGYRNSERIWLLKVVRQSHGETLSLDIETLPGHLKNFQWSREHKWNRGRVIIVQSCPERKIFGDLIAADHKVLSEGSESRDNHRYAVMVQDLATQWFQSYSCNTRTSQETHKSLMKYLEPTRKPKSFTLTIPWNLASWNHFTSTPHRSETTGIAQRAVRRVKEGTSAVLLQSGLGNEWWAVSLECYCFLRNIQDLLSEGKAPCGRRFGMPFDGPVIPCLEQ